VGEEQSKYSFFHQSSGEMATSIDTQGMPENFRHVTFGERQSEIVYWHDHLASGPLASQYVSSRTIHLTQGPGASHYVDQLNHVSTGENATFAGSGLQHVTAGPYATNMKAPGFPDMDQHVVVGPRVSHFNLPGNHYVGGPKGSQEADLPGFVHVTSMSRYARPEAHVSEGENATNAAANSTHITRGQHMSEQVLVNQHYQTGPRLSELTVDSDYVIHISQGNFASAYGKPSEHINSGAQASSTTLPPGGTTHHLATGEMASSLRAFR
jgi:hypothetical protein